MKVRKRKGDISSTDEENDSRCKTKPKRESKRRISNETESESEFIPDDGQFELQPGGTSDLGSMKPPSKKKNKLKSGKDSDGESSSGEERWLESRVKDPKLMTARQRAMYDRTAAEKDIIPPEVLVSLPTGYKEKEKILTVEAMQKAAIKSQQRKKLADEKREKDKQKTMERLLKKQDSKLSKSSKSRQQKTTLPVMTYRSTEAGSVVIMPEGYDYPIKSCTLQELKPKPVEYCAMCQSNVKRYNCSKTNVPLCSFRCYKDNVASLKSIIC